MLVVKNVKYLVPNSSLNKFVAECSDGLDWVIHLKDNHITSSKRLFSEFFTSKLAKEFGINVPDVSLVNISIDDNILESLQINESYFDSNCDIGVASRFIESKTLSNLFKLSGITSENRINNRDKVIDILKQSPNFNHIYGMKVFLHWIYLGDYHKGDTLQIDTHKRIIFYDFNLAFMNSSYPFFNGSFNDIWCELKEYSYQNIKFNRFNFSFDYVLDDISYFEEWFDKLREISKEKIYSELEKMPKCWEVPNNYLNNLFNFIFESREKYLQEFVFAVKKNFTTM